MHLVKVVIYRFHANFSFAETGYVPYTWHHNKFGENNRTGTNACTEEACWIWIFKTVILSEE
jgi:hypothetical protein